MRGSGSPRSYSAPRRSPGSPYAARKRRSPPDTDKVCGRSCRGVGASPPGGATSSPRAASPLRPPRDTPPQLAAAGSPLPLAAAIASQADYDIHALIELVERGCPPDLAARILAPLDAGTAA